MKNRLTTAATYLLATATTAALFTACSSNTDPTPASPLTNGVFVLNEGNFSDNNGSLSWLTRTSNIADNGVFQTRNLRPLTGGVAGYVEAGNRGIILVDNSTAGLDKVEIVTSDLLKSVKTLAAPDIENPRDAARINDTKVYVTCWGTTGVYPDTFPNSGYIAVIDLTTNTVIKKIPVQKGPEGITVVGSEAFVASVSYSGSKVITVVDTQTDAVKQQLTVTADGDNLLRDANNKLWTLAGKNAIRINPSTKLVEATIPVGAASSTSSPSSLAASADEQGFYYKYANKLYRFSIADATITPTTPVINRTFVGLTGVGFDAQSNVIYAGVTPSYKQAGYVYRYQATGQLIDSVMVDVAPVGFFFK